MTKQHRPGLLVSRFGDGQPQPLARGGEPTGDGRARRRAAHSWATTLSAPGSWFRTRLLHNLLQAVPICSSHFSVSTFCVKAEQSRTLSMTTELSLEVWGPPTSLYKETLPLTPQPSESRGFYCLSDGAAVRGHQCSGSPVGGGWAPLPLFPSRKPVRIS